MRIILTLFFLCFLGFYKAQEKRIALVIGNAEYVHASPLKNPVNDAELMKSTLISLGFDVIMANNIKTERQFLDTLRSFQRKSAAYNVRFLYYAGHAVQIGEENFLLPTEEKFEIKTDFSDYAIPLSKITTAFTQVENEINIVILDACRDNPFKNVSESRGVIVENLLNEQSSDGVLIAYATTSGSTASDGLKESKNSVFCTSLAKNMMFPDIPFEDVLKKVRIDVKQALNQKPEYRNSLENTLYLKKSTYTDQIIEIDSLINAEDYELAKEKVIEVLTKAPDYKLALLRRGRIEYNLKNKDYNGSHLFKADSLYPNDPHIHEYLGRYYSTIGEIEKAIKSMNEAIDLDSQDPDLFYWRARFFEKNNEFQNAESDYTKSIMLDSTVKRFVKRSEFFFQFKEYELALKDYTKVIALDKENPESYAARAECYIAMKENTAALKDLDKAIDLDPKNPNYYNDRADFYSDYHQKEKDDLALKDYATALDISTDTYETLRALNNRALIFQDQEKFDLALEEYNKAIDISPKEPKPYSNKAEIYTILEKYELAILEFTNIIALDKENPESYAARAECYIAMKENTAALKDLDKAIDLDPKKPNYYNNRADYYREYKNEPELALKDYATALDISTDTYETIRALKRRALIFQIQEKYDLALEEYNKAIDMSPDEPYIYSIRALIFQIQEKYELALKDYTQAIELEPTNPNGYADRASFYKEVLKRPYDALVDYSLAISLDSTDINLWWYRGKLFSEELNNQELAIKDFNQILKIKPNDINALNWTAIFYDRNNDVSNAIIGYMKIISLGDSIKKLEYKIEDYGWANINLAEIYQCENKVEEAMNLYNEGVTYMPEYEEAYYWRSWFFALYLKKYEDAIADFSKAIKLDPKNPYWLLNRSKIYHMKGDLKSAKSDMNDAVKISNESAIYIAERGNFYSVTGEFDKATKDFKESIKLDSLSRRTFHYLTENLIRQGKIDDALKNASESMTKFKNDTISFEQIGRINFAKNDLFKSLSAYTQAASIMEFNEGDRTIYPHDIQVFLSDVYVKIAEIYEKLNQSDLKCEFLNKAKDTVIFETRPDRQKMIKEIREKLIFYQN